MNNAIQSLIGMAMNSPQAKNSPFAKEGLGAIANNDNNKGEQIANNILQSYGMTKEEGLQKAREFFNLR